MRKVKEFCEGEIVKRKVGDTTIVCQEKELLPHRCERIIENLEESDVNNTEEVYIADADCLVDVFRGDETVRLRLIEEEGLGMNRNRLAHESPALSQRNTTIPRQALVVTDHPDYGMFKGFEIENEIIRTIQHENAHLGGIRDEEEAEKSVSR